MNHCLFFFLNVYFSIKSFFFLFVLSLLINILMVVWKSGMWRVTCMSLSNYKLPVLLLQHCVCVIPLKLFKKTLFMFNFRLMSGVTLYLQAKTNFNFNTIWLMHYKKFGCAAVRYFFNLKFAELNFTPDMYF